jgi:DNA-directed RNA polymerase subunit RPC12/RpoP
LPKLEKIRRASFPTRLAFLKKVAHKIYLRTPEGIDADDADAVRKHFASLFSCFAVMELKRKKSWVIVVENFLCSECRKEFDEKDCKVMLRDKRIRCPHCGAAVEEEAA